MGGQIGAQTQIPGGFDNGAAPGFFGDLDGNDIDRFGQALGGGYETAKTAVLVSRFPAVDVDGRVQHSGFRRYAGAKTGQIDHRLEH